MSHTIRILPKDDATNGWSKLLPERMPTASLAGSQRFDWVVLGAGYTGLAAARRIAVQRPSDTIALIDAGQVGENASGRNSGFAIELPHKHTVVTQSTDDTRRAIRVSRFAISELDRLIKEFNIGCDWTRSGKYHAAVTEAVANSNLNHFMDDLTEWGEEFVWLDREQLHEKLGTKHYHSAVYTPGSYLLNPAALCRGLARSMPANVTLFENSPVIEHDFDGPAPYVKTAQGSIHFNKLILAVAGFAEQFGVFKRQQIPMLLFASLTAPLNERQRAQLGTDEQWGLTPAHGVAGSTLRLTQDDRLLIRHGFEYSPSFRCTDQRRQEVQKLHRALLAKRFPRLADVAIEHFWTGWLGASANQSPAFGQVGPNVFAAACCNGVGVVRQTAAGTLIGDLACGVDNDLIGDLLSQGQAAKLPPRPFADVGIRLKFKTDNYFGRAEA